MLPSFDLQILEKFYYGEWLKCEIKVNNDNTTFLLNYKYLLIDVNSLKLELKYNFLPNDVRHEDKRLHMC